MTASAAPDPRLVETEGRWVPCPRCETHDAKVVVRSHDRLLGLPGEFRVLRCRRCGFLFTNPQPSDDTLARSYPSGYFPPPAPPAPRRGLRARLRAAALAPRGYPSEVPAPRRVWLSAGHLAGRLLAQRFLWLPPFLPGGSLVDVGCGAGSYLSEMRDLGWNVIGVEPSPVAAGLAREGLGLDVRQGSLEQVGLPDANADVAVMRMVLEHVPDPRRTLEEVSRILRPGGRLLLSVPNAGSVEAKLFGRHWFAWELPRHLSHFTVTSLTALLRETGFSVVRVRHLVNANNLAASLGYVLGRTGPARPWASRLLIPAAAALALARQSGRIAVEATKERPA